jgi:hypothetical protein
MPFWAAVRSLPMKERWAAEQLGLRGFEVFLPLVQTRRAAEPLFRGYCSRGSSSSGGRSITLSACLRLSETGDCPARVPDQELERLKSMVVGGYVRLPEAPAAPARRTIAIGAKVRITAGPFGGMSGLYAGQSTRERELVLLNVLGSQRPVAIAASLVIPR